MEQRVSEAAPQSYSKSMHISEAINGWIVSFSGSTPMVIENNDAEDAMKTLLRTVEKHFSQESS